MRHSGPYCWAAVVETHSHPRSLDRRFFLFIGIGGIAYCLGWAILVALTPLIGADPAWCCGWLAAATLTYGLSRAFGKLAGCGWKSTATP